MPNLRNPNLKTPPATSPGSRYYLADFVIEWTLEDPELEDPAFMNVDVFSSEKQTAITLLFKNASSRKWKHNSSSSIELTDKLTFITTWDKSGNFGRIDIVKDELKTFRNNNRWAKLISREFESQTNGPALKLTCEVRILLPDEDMQEGGEVLHSKDFADFLADSVPELSSNTPDSLKSRLLIDRGGQYLKRFRYTRNQSDLAECILAYDRAIQITPANDLTPMDFIHDAAIAMFERYKLTGNLSDVDTAISKLELGVRTSDDNLTMSGTLSDLGASYLRRFEHTGSLIDISEAISCQRKAVDLTPQGYAVMPDRLKDLGIMLLCRFKHTRDLADISAAISFHQKVVDLTLQGDAVMPARLNKLGISFQNRWKFTRDLIDISRAILCHQKAIFFTPEGHGAMPARLNLVGISFQNRFESTGDLTDISKAISRHQKAVSLTPKGHEAMPARLNELAISFQTRFKSTGDLSDLSEAISYQQEAVNLTHWGSNSDKLGWLTNLEALYQCRFGHTGDISDITNAMSYHQEVINLTPHGHVDKPDSLDPMILDHSKIDDLKFHKEEKTERKTFWIAAEHAMQHLQKNQAQIEAVFAAHDIGKSEYALYAGFDESLIQTGVGYLEQIHVFSSACSITGTSPLISQLGKIFSPFSSILFTKSSIYELPVYKADGSIWVFDELVFQMASKLIDKGSTAALYPTVISLSKTSGNSNPSGNESLKKSGSNNQEEKGDGNKGKGKEEDERGGKKEAENNDDDSGGDSDDPDAPARNPNNLTEPPMVFFDIVSEVFGTQDGFEKIFQLLTVQGKIMIQVDHHPSHLKCTIKFVELDFGTQRATVNTGYEQIHLRVTVDPRARDADAKAIQPRQTSTSDGEIKGISGSKSNWVHNSSIAGSFRLAPQATVTVGSSHTRETSRTFEKMQYTSQIVQQVLYGVVRWGFKIDDESDRKEGIKLAGLKLPEASFEFRTKSGSINPSITPVPSYIDVEVTSYWSLISPNKQALDWITSMLSRAQTQGVVYSNICQAAALTIPSDLMKRSDYKATLKVNIADPGLDCETIVREKDGQIGASLEISGADHYTAIEHGNWDNESLLTLPTLQHLTRTKAQRL